MSEKFEASTQYGDIKGSVVIDEADRKSFNTWARENGIDTGRYFPIAIDYYHERTGCLSIFTIDRVTSGSNEYDNIKDFINSVDVVPVKVFEIKKTLEEFIQETTKRFSIAATNMDCFINKEYSRQED